MTTPDFLKPGMCGKKKRFGDTGAAEAALTRMREARKVGHTEEMNIYRCPFCNFFHMGHKKQKAAE